MTTKLLLAVALFLAFVVGSSESRPQLPAIPGEFRNINFEQYLRNERAIKFQLKCIIYNGPCDTIGKFVKRNIPIYLRTQCKNCDDEQKKMAGKFIVFLQSNYPEEWDEALKKYGKTTYTDEEIRQFEVELGVKIFRDNDAPTRAPGTKPDIDGLVALAKEGFQAATNTKVPLILGRKDSSTTISLRGVTVPPQLAELSIIKEITATTTVTVPTSSSTTTTTTVPTPSSTTTTASSVVVVDIETDTPTATAEITEETTFLTPTEASSFII